MPKIILICVTIRVGLQVSLHTSSEVFLAHVPV